MTPEEALAHVDSWRLITRAWLLMAFMVIVGGCTGWCYPEYVKLERQKLALKQDELRIEALNKQEKQQPWARKIVPWPQPWQPPRDDEPMPFTPPIQEP